MEPGRRRENNRQAFDQDSDGQRLPGLDHEIQEFGDPVQGRTGHAGPGLGNGRHVLPADGRETSLRRRVVGDVLRDVVDLTGRQELLEPQAATSPRLPEDLDVGHGSSPNTQSTPPCGTRMLVLPRTRSISCCRSASTPHPDNTATYCLPSTA